MGSYIPNSFQTPNVLVDEIMPLLTPQEYVVLSFAVRHILGWQDTIENRKNRISISRFVKCGLARTTIMTALDQLVQFRLLEPIGEPTAQGQMWRLTFDNEPDIDGLINRKQDRSLKYSDRTSVARASLSHRPVVSQTDQSQSVPQTSGGLSHRHNKTHSSNTNSNTSMPNGNGTSPKQSKQYLDSLFEVLMEHYYRVDPTNKDARAAYTGELLRLRKAILSAYPSIDPDELIAVARWFKNGHPADFNMATSPSKVVRYIFDYRASQKVAPPRVIVQSIPDDNDDDYIYPSQRTL